MISITGDVGQMIIPLPPLAEQKRIVEKIDQLMALCDKLEEKLGSATEKRTRILFAIISEVCELSPAV